MVNKILLMILGIVFSLVGYLSMLTITTIVDKYNDNNYDPITNPVKIYPGKKIKKVTRISLKTSIKKNITHLSIISYKTKIILQIALDR